MNENSKPRWGHLKACDIRRRDIIDLLDEITVERGRMVYANRIRALVSGIFSFALRREVVESSPCVGLPRKNPEKPRERVLNDEEIVQFWQATQIEEPVIRDLFRVLLLLGQRSGETRAMQWSQIKEGIWSIPASLTKNGKEQLVPLPPDVLTMLEAHRGEHSFVFVSRHGEPLKWIRKANCRLRSRMNSMEPWTVHDLRRTCATGLERLGFPEAVVDSILNHSKETRRGVTARYVRHAYLEEKRKALEAWCAYVFHLVGERRVDLQHKALGQQELAS